MSSTSHPNTDDIDGPAAARRKIDEEIVRLEARIITLKTSRNHLIPFARLHPEIIQEVFALASHEPGSAGKSSLIISWVCNSWRMLALRTSALWSIIDFSNPTWVEAALSRTRNRQLSFDLSTFPNNLQEIHRLASLCLGNLPRMSTLSIRPTRGTILGSFTQMNPLWANSAPLLVELDLSGLALPSNALSGSCPALRTLTLSSCEFRWEWLPIHKDIRSLSISGPTFRTSVADIMHKLRCIGSQVEKLSLHQTLLLNPGPQPSGARTDLVKLQSLDLDERDPRSLTCVLDQISLPLHPDTTIRLQGGIEQLDAARAFVSSRGTGKWLVSSLEINLQETEVTIILEEWDLEPGNRRQFTDTHFTIERFGNLLNLIAFLDILPLPQIGGFGVLTFSGGYMGHHGSTLTDYFNLKGAVEQLDVNIYFVPTFTDVINAQISRLRGITGRVLDVKEELDDDTKAQCCDIIIFHQLTTLHYYGELDRPYLTRRNYTVLREWLMWRRVAGLGLKSLRLMEMKTPPHTYLTTLYEGVVDEFDCVETQEVGS